MILAQNWSHQPVKGPRVPLWPPNVNLLYPRNEMRFVFTSPSSFHLPSFRLLSPQLTQLDLSMPRASNHALQMLDTKRYLHEIFLLAPCNRETLANWNSPSSKCRDKSCSFQPCRRPLVKPMSLTFLSQMLSSTMSLSQPWQYSK